MSETTTNVPGFDDVQDEQVPTNVPGLEDAEDIEDPVTPRMRTWLGSITDLSQKSAQTKVLVDKHQEALDAIARDLNRETIKATMTFEVTKVPDGVWETFKDKLGMLDTLKSIDKGGDPMKEIDTWHDLPGTKGLPDHQVTSILDIFSKILKTAESLESNPAYQVKNAKGEMVPDFVKIGNDVWQPLVREGIIPENVVPDKYSEVARTFKGAAEAYDARLVAYSKDLSSGQALMAKAKPFFNVAEGLLKVGSAGLSTAANATAVQDGVNSIQQSEGARDLMRAKTIVDTTLLCVVTSRMVGEKLLAEDVHGVVDVLNACLKGVLVTAGFKDEANVICNVITVASRGPKLIEKLAEGDVAGALDSIGEAVAAGVTAGNSSNATIGTAIKLGFNSLSVAAIAVQKKDPKAALGKALSAAKGAGDLIGSEVLKAKRDEKIEEVKASSTLSPEEKTAQEKYLKTYFDTKPKGLDEIEKAGKTALELGIKTSLVELTDEQKAKIAKDKEEYDKRQQEAMLNFLAEPDPEFERALVNGFDGVADDGDESPEAELKRMEEQVNSIQTLIAMVKKDQMTFDLARNICEGGTGLLASFIPVAGIVAVGTKLIFSLLEAVKHTQQLVIWAENLEDARSAKTVQADAMLNRYNLQTVQTIRADIIVALRAVDLVGQFVKAAGGPAAPAGAAVSAAAQGTEGLMDVILTVKTEIEMSNAWSVYKQAIKTPQDRKLARKALQQNPTLAKYAMAYGALKEKHPVAVKAMNRCGLNAKTLSHPDTNLKNVVTYLETIYREDPTLLRPVAVPKDWHPGTPELDVVSWTKFYTSATTSKKVSPKVAPADVSKINATMAAYAAAVKPLGSKLDPGYVAQPDDDANAMRAAHGAAVALVSALGRYKPVDAKDGNPHTDMKDYLDELIGLANATVKAAAIKIDEIEVAQEAARLRAEQGVTGTDDDPAFDDTLDSEEE